MIKKQLTTWYNVHNSIVRCRDVNRGAAAAFPPVLVVSHPPAWCLANLWYLDEEKRSYTCGWLRRWLFNWPSTQPRGWPKLQFVAGYNITDLMNFVAPRKRLTPQLWFRLEKVLRWAPEVFAVQASSGSRNKDSGYVKIFRLLLEFHFHKRRVRSHFWRQRDATLIQATWMMFTYKADFIQTIQDFLTIQRSLRGHFGRNRYRVGHQERDLQRALLALLRNKIAIQIQRALRGSNDQARKVHSTLV